MVLLLLVAGAALEIWVAIAVADQIGALPVALLVVGSALIGARVLSRGTVRAWRRVGDAAQRGEPVGRGLADTGLVVLAGALLLTPGLVSGAAGLVLLLPPARAILRPVLGGLLARRMTTLPSLDDVVPPWAAGRRSGGPADVEGHATERPPRHDGAGAVSGVVLPAPAERDPRERD